jgi:hypothetical protein
MDHRIWVVHFLALNVRRRIETYSLDLFVVRTISFKLLYGLVILGDGRRRLARIGVTSNPIAEWITGQVTEAFLGTKHLDT